MKKINLLAVVLSTALLMPNAFAENTAKQSDDQGSSAAKQKFSAGDTVITAKIKGKFIERELFGKKSLEAMETHVHTKDGVVTLTGHADTQQQIDNAVSIAKSIQGVKEVKSEMKVEAH